MKFLTTIFIVIVIVPFLSADPNSFKQQQQQYQRYQAALAEKDAIMRLLVTRKGVKYPPAGIFLRVFKEEKEVELWAHSAPNDTFSLVKKYDICSTSGTLGPKRRQGDCQIPEGFYHINRFNPVSDFYLSLGINYPNASDRILGTRGRLGGDIFIHGDCVTIGCIPITDDSIKELYIVAVEAKSNNQHQIPVHIFPIRMNESGYHDLQQRYHNQPALLSFWQNLKPGFDFFDQRHQLPGISVDASGRYIFNR